MAAVISRDLVACADPAVWVRKYPWRATAAAFSLGFALTRTTNEAADESGGGGGEEGNGKAQSHRGSRRARRRTRDRRKHAAISRLMRMAGKLLRSAILGPIPFVH